MIIQTLIDYLETIAPPQYQESYDNAGLIVGDAQAEIAGVLICLDSTEAVVEEASRKGCNLIVAHHPIIFRGLKSLTGRTYVERVVMKAIKHNIAIYAIHTNLDNVYFKGVNAKIAEKLGLVNTRILAPKLEPSIDILQGETRGANVGAGLIGELLKAMKEIDFLHFLKDTMQTGCLRHTELLGREINVVAVCGGAGGFLLTQAINQGAQIFVSADYKYHEFFDADGRIVIADIGHYESEQFTIQLLYEIITEKFRNFAVRCTETVTNPVNYFF